MSNLQSKITITAVDKVSKIVKDISSSIDRLKVTSTNLTGAWNNVATAGGELVSKIRNLSLVAFAGGSAIFAFTKHYSELSEELLLTSQRTGIGVEGLQKLQFAAKMGNIPIDQLNVSLRFLNNSITNATVDPTSAAALAFTSMGIKLRDATGHVKNAETVFNEIADVFARNADGAKKVTTATTVLGNRTGQNLIPILNKGSAGLKQVTDELFKYGKVLTTPELQQNATLSENFKILTTAISGVATTLATVLIPVIVPMIKSMSEWIAVNKVFIADNIKQFITDLGAGLKVVWTNLKVVKDYLLPVVIAFGGFKTVIELLAGLYIVRFAASFVKLGISLFQITKAFGSFSLALFASPITWIIGAVALLGLGLYELYKHWDRVKQIMISIWPSVKPYFEAFMNVITLGMYSVAKSIYNNWDTIKPYLISTWNYIKESASYYFGLTALKITESWNVIRPYLKSVWDAISSEAVVFLDSFFHLFGTSFDKVAAKIKGVFDSLKKGFKEFLGFIEVPFKFLGHVFTTVMDKIIAIKDAITGRSSTPTIKNPELKIQRPGNLSSTLQVLQPPIPKQPGILNSAIAPIQENPQSQILNQTFFNSVTGFKNAAEEKVNSLVGGGTESKYNNLQNLHLDIYMKIDSAGRPEKVTAKSDKSITFEANTGLMV